MSFFVLFYFVSKHIFFMCVYMHMYSMCVFFHTVLCMFKIFICVINTEPLSSYWPVIPVSFQQVLQPSLRTLSILPQFARAAVCMQQVIVAPHNSSYRERMRERNLIYFMPTKPVGLNWLREIFCFVQNFSNHFHFQISNMFL